MQMVGKKTRRKFIKIAGTVGLAGAGLSGNASAMKNGVGNNNTGADDIGITDTVHGYLREGKEQKARDLLSNYDVKHSITTEQVSSEGGQPTIGTREAYDSGDSYVTMSLFHRSGSRYSATGTAILDGSTSGGFQQETSDADDQFGMKWDNDDWEAHNPTKSSVTTWIDGNNSDKLNETIDEYSSNYGIVGTLGFPNEVYQTNTYCLGVRTDIHEDSGNPHIVPVKFRYQHNTAVTGTGGIAGVSVNIGSFGIKFNISNAKKQWDKATTASP